MWLSWFSRSFLFLGELRFVIYLFQPKIYHVDDDVDDDGDIPGISAGDVGAGMAECSSSLHAQDF